MKTALSVTLVICGMIVIAIPALSHAWDAFMISMTLTHMSLPGSSVNFIGISDSYQFGCYVLGAAMIFVSVFSSFAGRNRVETVTRLSPATA